MEFPALVRPMKKHRVTPLRGSSSIHGGFDSTAGEVGHQSRIEIAINSPRVHALGLVDVCKMSSFPTPCRYMQQFFHCHWQTVFDAVGAGRRQLRRTGSRIGQEP